jgi:hypothetical protein
VSRGGRLMRAARRFFLSLGEVLDATPASLYTPSLFLSKMSTAWLH